MMNLLAGLDSDEDLHVSRAEFGQLLEKPKAIKALQEVGVDVLGLAELSDFIYKEKKDLSFSEFMETVLQLRGTNTATVKSIVDMRMFMTKELGRVEKTLTNKLHQVFTTDLWDALTKNGAGKHDSFHAMVLPPASENCGGRAPAPRPRSRCSDLD